MRAGVGAAIIAAVGIFAWQRFKTSSLPEGFASSNGRLEAVEIDIATKAPGRIKDILVNEGDFVRAGQVLANMDTAVLEAQRREAAAQLQRARISIETAQSQVAQREAEKTAALAVVAQRQAEFDAASKRFARTQKLGTRGIESVEKLDDDRARFEGARAAVSAAEAQSAAAVAAIASARSQVIGAEAEVEAVRATIERLQADIDDSVLRSPRDGRVQYRVAQPGEVLSAGGRVLNLVDLGDVYMTFFLPTKAAGRVALGTEVRLVLDALPH
jgi:HlyD family secretion protein